MKLISELEEKNKISLQTLNDSNKKEFHTELNSLSLKYQNEKNDLIQEINILKQKTQELKSLVSTLNKKEIEYKIIIEKNNSELEFLKNENLDLLKNEEDLYDKELASKNFIEELTIELNKDKDFINELEIKKEELKHNNEKLLKSHQEYEKQVNETLKKHSANELKLKNTILSLEDTNKTLEDELKANYDTINGIQSMLNQNEENYKSEINILKSSYEKQIEEEIQENAFLAQENSVIKESHQVEIDSLHKKIDKNIFIISQLEREVSENSEIRDINLKLSEESKEKTMQITILTDENNKKEVFISEIQSKISEISLENKELLDKLHSLDSELTISNENYKSSSEIIHNLNEELIQIKKANSNYFDDIGILNNRIYDLESKITKNNEENDKLIAQVSINENMLKELTGKLNESLEKNIEIAKTLEQERQTRSSLNNDLQLQQENSKYFDHLKLENEDLSAKIRVLQSENEDFTSKIQGFQSENERLSIDIENHIEIISNLKADQINLKTIIDETQENYENLKIEFENLSEDNIKIYEEHSITEVKLNQATFQLDEINASKDEEIQGLKSKLLKLEQELKNEKNEKIHILREFNEVKIQKASLEKLSNDEKSLSQKSKDHYSIEIESLSSKYSESQKIIESLEQKNSLLEHEIKELNEINEQNLKNTGLSQPRMSSSLNKEFIEYENDTAFDFFSKDNSLVNSLQNEKWELQNKIQGFEEEKMNLEAQIEEFTKEIDMLYERNLNLKQENQILITEKQKKQENHSNFSIVSELERKIKEKDEELLLVKQSFKELVEKTAEQEQKKQNVPKQNVEEGWISSVIGSIFLTDKERGTG